MAECATVGISQTTPVYLYCFKGGAGLNTFLALKKRGVKDVRMYFGSWNRSRDPWGSRGIDGCPRNRQSGSTCMFLTARRREEAVKKLSGLARG